MKINVREARREDVLALKDKLREADHAEVIAAGDVSVEDALSESYERSSLRFCLEIEGTPAALFGIVPDSLVGEGAKVWLLGTDDLGKIKKSFVKMSRATIAEFLVVYPRLWNLVDGRYEKTIRWLKRLGAIFYKEPIMMSSGVEFYGFTIGRP